MTIRSQNFSNRSHNRYWWHRHRDNRFTPPIFQNLSDDEWEILNEWFYDSEQRYPNPGEIGVPGFSFISGLVSGNGISRIVQCGHYVGFSSLMFGFLMRSIGKERSVYSIDIDASVTEYTNRWLEGAELNSYVKLAVNDSSDENNIVGALEWLGGAPQIVFIDSSHQYEHTIRELDFWYDQVAPGGFILMHDVSTFAQQFDSTGKGGVKQAVIHWCDRQKITPFLMNSFVDRDSETNSLIYKDGCGLGIIQKPL